LKKELVEDAPLIEQVIHYVHKTLSEGKVIPSYGPAELRKTTLIFILQIEFTKKYRPNDNICNIVWNIYNVVHESLSRIKKSRIPGLI